jgi:class 3 adenylate cyclase
MNEKENMKLLPNEFENIDSYLKESKTSVLTILFTDIEGYTAFTDEKGDEAANEVRLMHNEIMLSEIEKQGNGKIIKFVGDAVMAIFSEPSSAALISVNIQRKFHRLFEEGSFPLKFRMGLHMGQVTIENKIGHDIFGRHVNKAARVESQASGGQIFITHTVLETLKGNFEINGVRFHEHGKVKAKGIKDEFEIYELLYLTSQKPILPKGIKPKFLKTKILLPFIILFCISLIGVYTILNPKVLMYNTPDADLILDGKHALNLINIENQKYKEIDEKIFIGDHTLHYQVNSIVRYYTAFKVRPFMKFFKPMYKEVRTPSHDFYIKDSEKQETLVEKELNFKIPNKQMEMIERKVKFRSTQKLTKFDDRHVISMEYVFVGPNGKLIKGNFEKVQLDKDGSYSHTIKLANDKEIEYSIYLSFWGKSMKVIYRVDFKNIK